MEWKEVTLGELGTIVGGATPSTKNPSFYDGNIPWLTPKDLSVNSNMYILRGERNITEAGFKSCSCKMLPKGSVLFSSRAPIGYVAIAANDMCTNQGFKSVIPNEETDSEFLYYLLKYNKDYIASQGSGTTFAEVSGKTMKDIEVVVPKEKEDQHRIASILSSLDRKIELNNKINADLEEMAQAVFKNWFVDFEPFKNGKFVDSELGMIPEGWKVGKLFDIAEIFDKKRKPLSGNVREKMDKIYPYYGATSCMDYVDDYIFDGIYTLIGEDGSVVKENGLPYMQYVWGKMWVNNHAHILQGKNGYSTEMIHALLSITNIKFLVTGAVQAKLSQGNMQKILVAIPPKNVLEEIRPVIDNLYSKIRINTDENSRLSTLRDTLLPRLMSGELEVPE